MKNINFDISTANKKGSKSALIKLGGDLSLKNAAELKNRFVEVKNSFDKVEIHVENVTNLDLAAVQLFLSLKKAFNTNPKNIEIHFNLSEEMETIMKRSGFSGLLSGNKKSSEN